MAATTPTVESLVREDNSSRDRRSSEQVSALNQLDMESSGIGGSFSTKGTFDEREEPQPQINVLQLGS